MITQTFLKNSLIQTVNGLVNINDLKKDNLVFDSEGKACRILKIIPKIQQGYVCYSENSTFFIGKTHDFKVENYSHIYKTKSIKRSNTREERARQLYLRWQEFKKYEFLSLNEVAALFNKSTRTIREIIKNINPKQDLKNINMIIFVDKYIEYQEKIRLNRVKNGKTSKKNLTKISDFLKIDLKAKTLWKFAFPKQNCFEYNLDTNIFIDPYVLGYWLGDGFSRNNVICGEKHDLLELKEYLKKNNIAFKDVSAKTELTVGRIRLLNNMTLNTLRSLNLICNKHIPKNYLTATKAIRLKLLAGLIDSDGCVDKNGNIEITVSNKKLALDIYRLIYGLGIYITKVRYKMTSYTKEGKKLLGNGAYRLYFTDTNIPLNLSRKKDRLLQKKTFNKQLHNFFKSCKENKIDLYYEIKLDSDNIIIPLKSEIDIFK